MRVVVLIEAEHCASVREKTDCRILYNQEIMEEGNKKLLRNYIIT